MPVEYSALNRIHMPFSLRLGDHCRKDCNEKIRDSRCAKSLETLPSGYNTDTAIISSKQLRLQALLVLYMSGPIINTS